MDILAKTSHPDHPKPPISEKRQSKVKSRKLYSFRHILKRPVNMYESSGSHFLRTTTTGIQSRLDAFNEPRLVMTLLNNFGVAVILCISRLVLEGNIGKEIR